MAKVGAVSGEARWLGQADALLGPISLRQTLLLAAAKAKAQQGAVLDEVQRVPDLLSYLQGLLTN